MIHLDTKTVIVNTFNSPYARLRPVPLTSVKLRDSFWAPRIDVLLHSTLPAIFEQLDKTGPLDNFRRLVGKAQAEFKGYVFADEHVYKWLEAAVWLLSYKYSEELLRKVEEVTYLAEVVQEPDGYINTRFHGKPKERYRELKWSHELYVGGHLIQAAIACKRVGVCERFFNVALKYGEHLINSFGPGRIEMPDGHPGVELALIELYRETGDKEYVELAEFLIEMRGRGKLDYAPYFIDNKPFKQLSEAPSGAHAVRLLYLTSGATDLYIENGDKELLNTLEKLWFDIASKRLYVTGGVGSRYLGEAIGEIYELPNESAYAETCAAVANVMWNYRLLLATGEARYADMMELTLYNGALSGISLDGKNFFYVNPLADRGSHRRQPWLHCPCCPPNIARLLASLPGYFYSVSDDGIWVHLYASNDAIIELGRNVVTITQDTMYPWDGRVTVRVYPKIEDEFAVYLRVPGWVDNLRVRINGELLEIPKELPTYIKIEKTWKYGDTIELSMEMPVKLIISDPRVISNTGKAAIKRGPIVYCLEQADNPNTDVWSIGIVSNGALKTRYVPDMLGGVALIEGEGYELRSVPQRLYGELDKANIKTRKINFRAIPYYAWANREPGPMTLWIPLIDLFRKLTLESSN